MEIDPQRIQRRRRSLSMWLSMRAILTGITALIVAFILQSTTLPKLAGESRAAGTPQPRPIQWLLAHHHTLPALPAAAIILGIAAIAWRRFRPLLAALSVIAVLLSLVAIVATLVGAMLPLYQMPPDLMNPH
jgi:hypothetical protein